MCFDLILIPQPDFKEEENGYTNGHTDEQHQNEQEGNTGVPESPTERPNPPSSEATKSQKRYSLCSVKKLKNKKIFFKEYPMKNKHNIP